MSGSRILIAVSSPWAGERMAASVRDLADRLAGSVVVAHVARTSEEDESEEQARQRSEQALASLLNPLKELDVSAEDRLLYGDDVARAILNAAEQEQATLVVLGLTGKGRIARLLGGDVPRRVIRSARVPVLLLPPDWSGRI